MKILVIDDDEALIYGINAFFRNKGVVGVEAECCKSFDEAIMAIGRHHPSIILLDDDLGKTRDGLEIARVLKEQNPTRYQIISTTGTTNQDILDEYRGLGIPLLKKEQVSMVQWIKERLAQDPK